ncbi:MAG: hypothetical protein ACE5NJ_09695 [Thermodesulfobacteriota bacterium]
MVTFRINIHGRRRRPGGIPRFWIDELRISLVILIPLMILLLLGVGFAYIKASASLDRDIRMNRPRKNYLLDQLNKVQEDLKKAGKRRDLLSKQKRNGVEWSGKLVALSKKTHDDLWLTDLRIRKTTKGEKASKRTEEETYLTIKGFGEINAGREPLNTIAQVISSLNSLESFQGDFDPARLVYTRISGKKDRVLIEFEISSKLKAGAGANGRRDSK